MRLTCTVFFVLGLALPAFAQNVATAPPQAQVTFYSHGVTVMGGLPGHEPGAFKGRIYDEDHQLAFIEPGHFVTFNLNPGLHILSATWWITKHAKGGSHVTINLVANQHYFIETSVLNSGFAFGNLNLVVKEVTCEGAQQDNVHNKPLEPTHLRPDGVPIAVLDKAFPQCP